MMLVLARVPALRLLRTPRGVLTIAGWMLVAIVSALLARAGGSGNGADHVMRGSFASLVLPLLSYAIVGAVVGRSGITQGIRGVVALGADPRRAALASVGVAVGAAAVAGAVLAALVCALAHGAHDPPLGRDVFTSLWVGGLGGGAYGAYFSAGSAIGRGWLRGVFLVIDWVAGSGSGISALFTPRGHVEALLGGPLCAEMPQRVSSSMLVAMIVIYVVIARALTRRPG